MQLGSWLDNPELEIWNGGTCEDVGSADNREPSGIAEVAHTSCKR